MRHGIHALGRERTPLPCYCVFLCVVLCEKIGDVVGVRIEEGRGVGGEGNRHASLNSLSGRDRVIAILYLNLKKGGEKETRE